MPVLASLAPALTAVRLSLHVLGATVWVGGQITVLGLLPTVRSLGEGAPKAVARSLARLLWPAYALLVVTGVWNIEADHPGRQPAAWVAVLGVKIGVVALAGLATWLHSHTTSRRAVALWGALAGLSSVAALVLGVLLAG